MFNSKVKTAAELSANATKVLNVFSSTISGLRDIVDSARESISEKIVEIQAAQEEKDCLEKIVSSNESIIEKVESILK